MDARDQLKEVQDVLDRLTRFRHLNGWAAIVAGILTIVAYSFMNYEFHIPWFKDTGDQNALVPFSTLINYGISLGALLLSAFVICGIIVLVKIPKDLTNHAWKNLMRLSSVYALYVVFGAVLVIALIGNTDHITLGILRIIPCIMCVLYGLAQIHAAHFSLSALRILGLICLLCGLLAAFLPFHAWFLWAMGFGLGHIVTGIVVLARQPS